MPRPQDNPWFRLLPTVHRAMADQAFERDIPSPERIDSVEQACGYWEALRYLLMGVLGWRNLDQGLAWWYSEGRHDFGDPVLKLVRRVWDSEGQLDYFAARVWSDMCILSPEDLSPTELAQRSLWADEDWWRTFKRRGRPYTYDPFYGGSNPLHLGHSDAFGFDHGSAGHEGEWDILKRTARLVVSDFACWRTDLASFGSKLPPLGERSWHVHVAEREVGLLGHFRRSRITGNWFIGKHSLHMRGNVIEGQA